MSVPVICPHCYKNLPAPAIASDGLVRCDACGHAFPPPAGASSAPGYQAPNYGNSPAPYSPVQGYGQPPAYNPLPSYGNSPSNLGPPYSTTSSKPPSAWPPAGGPQKPGNPGLVACGVVALFGLLGVACCGSAGFLVYNLANEAELANQPNINPLPFNPPAAQPVPFNPPPPIQIPPLDIHPEFPVIPPPVIPEAPSVDPFEPVAPPVIPGVPTPGTPAAPRTLDAVLSELKSVEPTSSNARQLLTELDSLPVDDSRRGEVVDAVLDLFKRAEAQAFVLAAGPGQAALEKWASAAEALKLAKFAAEDASKPVRRFILLVLAKTGGDAETAKAILPLVDDPGLTFALRDVLEKIGPPAEDPLLEHLDAHGSQRPNIFLYQTLGKIGGEKTRTRMQTLAKTPGAAGGFARIALRELERRAASPNNSK